MTDHPNSRNLKSTGLKATLPRLRILQLFQKMKSTSGVRHMTADDVHRLLATDRADIGLATVYRVLTHLEQAGLLIRRNFETGKTLFELNEGTHHDHLICLQCGKVEEFHDPDIENRQTKLAKERGFDLHEHALTLYGDCVKADCPNRKSTG